MLPNATSEVSDAGARAQRRQRVLAQLQQAAAPLLGTRPADPVIDRHGRLRGCPTIRETLPCHAIPIPPPRNAGNSGCAAEGLAFGRCRRLSPGNRQFDERRGLAGRVPAWDGAPPTQRALPWTGCGVRGLRLAFGRSCVRVAIAEAPSGVLERPGVLDPAAPVSTSPRRPPPGFSPLLLRVSGRLRLVGPARPQDAGRGSNPTNCRSASMFRLSPPGSLRPSREGPRRGWLRAVRVVKERRSTTPHIIALLGYYYQA
jgi:hypothetical protein